MQCKVNAVVTNCGVGGNYADVSGSAVFAEDEIICKLEGYANVKMNGIYYNRDGIAVSVAFGTIAPLSKSISMYSALNVTETEGYSVKRAIRVGNANDEETTITTPTILVSGNTNELALKLGENYPYFIFGDSYSVNAHQGGSANNPGLSNITLDQNNHITEIYLV